MGKLQRKLLKNQTNSTNRRVKTAEEAYQEGLQKGIKQGFAMGKERGAEVGFIAGWKKACDHFLEVLYHLDEVPDIGPKRYQKIIERFGYQEKADFAKQGRWMLDEGETEKWIYENTKNTLDAP